jgi:hypothetical protein
MNIRMFVLMVLAASIMAADVITINDTTDTVTLSTTSTRYVVVSSTPESGSLNSAMAIGVSAPTGATFGSTTIPSYFISSAAGFPDLQYAFVASENGSNQVSDVLAFSTTPFANFPAPFALFFNSDGDPPTVTCGQTPHGCNVVETGPISGTITWALPTGATVVDTITFNSDVNEVPEPSAMLLLFTGLVGLAVYIAARRSASRQF